MKKYLIINVLLFSMLCVSFSQSKKPAKYLLKIATEVPAGTLWFNSLTAINKEVSQKTDGEVRIQVYAGGVMGDQNSVISKMKLGQIDGASFSNTGMQIIYHDFGVVGFPLMMRNEAEFDFLIEKMGGFFEAEFKKNGYTLLCWTETGPIYIYSKKSIDSEEGIQAAKAFVLPGDKITEALFREAKATPIPIQTADILMSLKTGQIDTVFSPPYGLVAMQWHANVNYVTDFPMTFMLGSIMLSNKAFEAMPEAYRVIVKETFTKHFNALKPKIRKDNVMAQEVLKQNGIRSVPVSLANQNRFFEIGRAVNEKLTKEAGYSKDFYQKMYLMMEEFRKKK